MKGILFFAAVFSISAIGFSQVGIGTINPNATLDVQSSNQVLPSNNDGILIPKIDDFPATIPTAAQDGMMVFVTGIGIVSKGFYYWDDSIPDWIPIATGIGSGHDWYEVSTTTTPNSINDSIYTYGNVAIGKNTADYKLDIFEDAADSAAYINLAGASNNPVIGLTTEITNTGDGDQRGVNTILNSSGIGNHFGVLNTLSGSGIGFKQGIRNELSGTSDGSQTGTRNLITNSGNGTHWAILNTLSGTGTGNHIGTQNSFSDIGSGFHTGFYSTFSEGTGILTGNWTEFGGNIGSSNSNQIASYNSYFAGGNGILAGSYTEIRSSVTGNGTQYGSFLNNSSSGSGTHYGIRNELTGIGTGDQEGVSTLISNSNNANHFGLNTRLNGTGTGTQIGAQFSMSGTGSGFHTGMVTSFTEGTGILTGNWIEFGGNVGNSTSNQIANYNSYFSGGNGILAGAYTEIRSGVTGTGNQYGTFLTNSSSGSGVHYGARNNLGGAGTGEQYGTVNDISNNGDASHYGTQNSLSGTGPGAQMGVRNTMTGGSGNLTGVVTEFGGTLGDGNQICAYNSYFVGGNGILAGAYTDIRNSVTGTGTHYGTFTTNASPGTGSHYGNYSMLSGTGQGLQVGNYNEIDNSGNAIHYAVLNRLSGTGTATHYGVRNELTGTGTGDQEGISTLISNSNNANHYGINTRLNGTGSGTHTGVLFSMSNTGGGDHTGVHTNFTSGTGTLKGNFTEITNGVTGSGTQYGTYLTNNSIGTGLHYGNYNVLNGTGAGNKYGSYNLINTTAGGTHYGVYSDAQKAGSYAGYFLGNILGSRRLELTATTDASETAGSGVLEIGGSLRIDGNEIITNTNSILYLQNGNDGDLRIDGSTVVVDAANNRIGINTTTPDSTVHIIQNTNAADTGGIRLENSGTGNHWTFFTAPTDNLWFAYNGVLASWIQPNGTYNTSDKRLKNDIQHMYPVMDKVLKLNPVTYQYNNDEKHNQTIGFLAQEVEPYFPESVQFESEHGYYGVKYDDFGVIAIKAIQEQQIEIELLKQQLEEQKAEVLELKNLIIGKQ